jgi:hypothetical protein
MTKNQVGSNTVLPRSFPFSCMGLIVCAAALFNGCSMRKRPSISWATAIQVRPTTLDVAVKDIPVDQVPDLRPEVPSFPLHLMTAHSAPPRPRVIAPSSAGGGNDAEKSEAPLLVPQLSATETVTAQQQTNQSLIMAEKNLQSTRGKRLNAAQLDLASKVKGFIKDAREAVTNADWARARSLSKKAQVLSEELVAAF